jgi:hypothetical protein
VTRFASRSRVGERSSAHASRPMKDRFGSKAEVLASQTEVSFGSHIGHRSMRSTNQKKGTVIATAIFTDLPDGQISEMAVICLSSPLCKNILIFRNPNHCYISRRPAPHKGRWPSSRTRGGMRWTWAAPKTRARACGRRSRVVLTPRRRRQVGGRQIRR